MRFLTLIAFVLCLASTICSGQAATQTTPNNWVMIARGIVQLRPANITNLVFSPGLSLANTMPVVGRVIYQSGTVGACSIRIRTNTTNISAAANLNGVNATNKYSIYLTNALLPLTGNINVQVVTATPLNSTALFEIWGFK